MADRRLMYETDPEGPFIDSIVAPLYHAQGSLCWDTRDGACMRAHWSTPLQPGEARVEGPCAGGCASVDLMRADVYVCPVCESVYDSPRLRFGEYWMVTG